MKTCQYVLVTFSSQFGKRDLVSVSQEEVMDFLLRLSKDNKQATRRNRYSVLSSFYNFGINSSLPALANPCNASMMKKIFKRPQTIQWRIVDKETVDEIIFRTIDTTKQVDTRTYGKGRNAYRRSFKSYAGRYSGRFLDHPEPEKWQAGRAGLCSTKNPGKVK